MTRRVKTLSFLPSRQCPGAPQRFRSLPHEGAAVVISDARPIVGTLCVACLGLIVILAGCGGSRGLDRPTVEQVVGEQIRQQAPDGTAVDNLACVDAGGGKWECVTYIRSGDEAARVILDVTCDDEARCVFSPGAIAALP